MSGTTDPRCPACGDEVAWMLWDTSVGATAHARCMKLDAWNYVSTRTTPQPGCTWEGRVQRVEGGALVVLPARDGEA